MRQPYVVVNNYFKQPFIDFVENIFEKHPELPGCDAWDKKDGKLLSELNEQSMNCHVKVVHPIHGGYNRIQNEIMLLVNNNITKLCIDIYQSLHSIQYGVYKQGSKYKPHTDTTPQETLWSKKLTVVILLSDDSDYVGGKFLLNNNPVLAGKGSAVIFPSHMTHSVTPIESGTRKTLSTWVVGPQWR